MKPSNTDVDNFSLNDNDVDTPLSNLHLTKQSTRYPMFHSLRPSHTTFRTYFNRGSTRDGGDKYSGVKMFLDGTKILLNNNTKQHDLADEEFANRNVFHQFHDSGQVELNRHADFGHALAMPFACNVVKDHKGMFNVSGVNGPRTALGNIAYQPKSRGKQRMISIDNGLLTITTISKSEIKKLHLRQQHVGDSITRTDSSSSLGLESAGSFNSTQQKRAKSVSFNIQSIYSVHYDNYDGNRFSIVFKNPSGNSIQKEIFNRLKNLRASLNLNARGSQITNQNAPGASNKLQELSTNLSVVSPPVASDHEKSSGSPSTSNNLPSLMSSPPAAPPRKLKHTHSSGRDIMNRLSMSHNNLEVKRSQPAAGSDPNNSRQFFHKSNRFSYKLRKSPSQLQEATEKSLIVTDDDGQPVGLKEETVFFDFDSAQECRGWLTDILYAIDKQASLFGDFANVIESTAGGGILHRNFEAMLRKSLDLFTLTRGHNDARVSKVRQRLGQVLLAKEQVIEANYWIELATRQESTNSNLLLIKNTTIVHSNTNDREALKAFFEEHGHGQLSLNDLNHPYAAADYMLETYSLYEICRRLEAEYGIIPAGLEAHVLRATPTALELIQSETPKVQERSW